MGMKARKRGVEMDAFRIGDSSLVSLRTEFEETVRFCTSPHICDFPPWPGPKLEPGECRKVRVIIEEVE